MSDKMQNTMRGFEDMLFGMKTKKIAGKNLTRNEKI